MVSIRWPDGVSCPACCRQDVHFMATRGIWKCRTNHPKQQFSFKADSIFEASLLGLEKWLPTMWMMVNCENGVSSYKLARSA